MQAGAASGGKGNVSAVHAVPGRARLRVEGLRGQPLLATALESGLTGRNGIARVSASTITSSLLIYYDPHETLPEIIAVVEVTLEAVDLTAVPAGVTPCPPPTGGFLGAAFAFLSDLLRSVRGQAAPRAAESQVVEPEALPEPWHALDARDVLKFWGTSPTGGLASRLARERLARYGANSLPQPRPRSALALIIDQLRSLPVLLLAGSAVLSAATGGAGDAIVIGAVVVLNAVIGAATEAQAERTIASAMNLSEPVATVLRDGKLQLIGGEAVVPGDVLALSRGAHVAADARLIETENLTADESALTGESMPVEKCVAALTESGLALADRTNLVFRGTAITGGSGRAVVIATGLSTELGKVQRLITESEQPETPLQRRMRELGGQLVWVTCGVAGMVFLTGLLRGLAPLEMLKGAVSLAVAAVPEGLPAVATVSLASSVAALARRRVLVRRLAAVESLGSVDVVCFDKTGTLTLNQMSLVAAFAGATRYSVSGGTFFSGKRVANPGSNPELVKLLEICSLCTQAEAVQTNGSVSLEGTPTETALLRTAVNSGVDVAALRRRFPLRSMTLRAEGRNYMATTHAAADGRTLVAMKGSPAEVLALCRYSACGGQVQPMTEPERRAALSENDRMAGAALRVLGIAYRDVPPAEPEAVRDMVWVGLAGIADPPREGLPELLGEFRQAGVKPVMVTGDQRATARAVGQALGLNGGDGLEVLDARQFDELEPEEIALRVPGVHIFARVSPAQKLQIVRAFQRSGRLVAMTGDGVNDGPALKAADVGIALGQSGTRVARDVADVLLTDDNIHALIPAIREGRRVQVNLRKAIHYIASTNMGEVAVMMASLAAGMGQPFSARQLLWINLITDVFPEVALAVGPPDDDLMRRSPVDPRAPVIGGPDLARLGAQSGIMAGSAFAAYVWAFARYGAGPRAGAVAFLTLTASQLLHSFTAAEPHGARNPYLSAAVAAGFGALALSQFGLAPLLGTVPIGLADALVCAGASIASLAANHALQRASGPRLLPPASYS